jgi:hypothetical protein
MKYGALNSIPRQTTIGGQPHMLAYINPEEESLIQDYRGNIPPVAGPDGVPAYLFGFSWGGGGGSSSSSSSSSSNDNDNDSGWSFSGIAESIGNAISTGVTAVGNFVSDAGQAAADTVVEIATFGTADTQTYNPTATATDTTATTATDTSTTTTSTKSFDDAFAEARAAGLEMFSWQGNFYNTNLAPVFYDQNGGEHATKESADAADAAIYAQSVADAEAANLADPSSIQNIDAQLEALRSQGFTANDPPIKALLEQKNTELANLGDKLSEGEDQVQAYIDKFGTSYLEDRFLVGRINPATGLPYQPRDTNMVNPLDADTMPYTPGGLDVDEIIYLGGEPFSSTSDGVEIGTGPVVNTDYSTSVNSTDTDTDEDIVDDFIDSGAYLADNFGSDDSYQKTREVRGTRDLIGDFIGGRSGGMWNRAPSYLTRFGYTPAGIDEMVRVVENADGTTSYYGADGALLNPELMEGVRLGGPTVSQKIGEENVLLGTQTLNPDGTVSDTAYTDLYDPELDAGLFNYS